MPENENSQKSFKMSRKNIFIRNAKKELDRTLWTRHYIATKKVIEINRQYKVIIAGIKLPL